MRTALCLISLALVFSHSAWPAPAKDGDPTPRKSMDPADAAVVKQFEAKRWLGFGANGGNGINGVQPEQIRSSVSGSIPGRRSCTTQIGSAAPPDVGPAGQPTTSPRFGQNKDNIVVVTGSVINVCR